MKNTILFVDDEPNILSGLQRMLRFLRHEMDFHFVESGREAIDFMTAHRVDVIVSDMRMPGMDGATLLAMVQEQFPHTIRILLTGQADEESIWRTVEVAHQLLAKPTSAETLQEVLGRTCALQNLLPNQPLRTIISSLGSLPSLPATYAELQRTLQDPECGLQESAAIIECDLAMSAKVLQLVNSAFFGFFKNIGNPSRGVHLLGLDTIKALAFSAGGVFSEFKPVPGTSFSVSGLWEHSRGVAAFAKRIAQAETTVQECIDNAFTAGLIHDIGKLILHASKPQEYAEVISLAKENTIAFHQAEQQLLNADHAAAGAYLLGLWGLPGSVVEAVAFHHQPDHCPAPSFCPAVAVHAADVIYHRLQPDLQCIPPALNLAYLEQAGVVDRFDSWVELCEPLGIKETA